MEFDKNKILTVVTADQLKEGQMGWINDYVDYLKSDTKNISPYKVFRTNENMCFDFPFAAEGRGVRRYFYPAPEPTYAERQAQWVKENNVKIGTKVRITRTFTEDEDGSRCWARNDLVGKTGIIWNIFTHILDIDMNDGNFRLVPYFALEVVKEPTYHPFNTGEEFKPFKDKWVLYNQATRRILSYNNIGVIIAQANWDDSGIRFISFETAFKEFQFEEGAPFGVKES